MFIYHLYVSYTPMNLKLSGFKFQISVGSLKPNYIDRNYETIRQYETTVEGLYCKMPV
jgi:hypothetical protein